MEKLKLKGLEHPNPYRVSWLKNGHQVTVIERCLLNFQIGKLSEKVLCDVVAMDACHISLGRPWLLDMDVSHDDKENTYEFKKDGQQYKLTLILENTTTTEENKDMNVDNS